MINWIFFFFVIWLNYIYTVKDRHSISLKMKALESKNKRNIRFRANLFELLGVHTMQKEPTKQSYRSFVDYNDNVPFMDVLQFNAQH